MTPQLSLLFQKSAMAVVAPSGGMPAQFLMLFQKNAAAVVAPSGGMPVQFLMLFQKASASTASLPSTVFVLVSALTLTDPVTVGTGGIA